MDVRPPRLGFSPPKSEGCEPKPAALFACSEVVSTVRRIRLRRSLHPFDYFLSIAPRMYIVLLDFSALNTYVPAGKSAANTLSGRAGVDALS